MCLKSTLLTNGGERYHRRTTACFQNTEPDYQLAVEATSRICNHDLQKLWLKCGVHYKVFPKRFLSLVTKCSFARVDNFWLTSRRWRVSQTCIVTRDTFSAKRSPVVLCDWFFYGPFFAHNTTLQVK